MTRRRAGSPSARDDRRSPSGADGPPPGLTHDFDRIARHYDRALRALLLFFGSERRFRARIAHAVIESLPPRPAAAIDPAAFAILELGCGTGSNLAALAQLARSHGLHLELIGADASAAMIGEARSKPELRNATLLVSDSGAVPLPDSSIDCVLCSLFLHELEEGARSSTMTEIARLLRPSGRLVVVDFSFTHRAGSRLLYLALRAIETRDALEFCDRRLEPLARSVGLRPLRTALVLGGAVRAFVFGAA